MISIDVQQGQENVASKDKGTLVSISCSYKLLTCIDVKRIMVIVQSNSTLKSNWENSIFYDSVF